LLSIGGKLNSTSTQHSSCSSRRWKLGQIKFLCSYVATSRKAFTCSSEVWLTL